MREPRSQQMAGRADVVGIGQKRAAGRTAMHIHLFFNGLAQILDKMEPVGYLQSLPRALACGLRIKATAIPADDFDLRMLPQPIRAAFNAAIREDINHRAPFEIDNNCPITLEFLPTPIINADDFGCGRSVLHLTFQLAQHRVIADADAQTVQKPFGWTPARGMIKVAYNCTETGGSAPVWFCDSRGLIGKGSARAFGRNTAPAANP